MGIKKVPCIMFRRGWGWGKLGVGEGAVLATAYVSGNIEIQVQLC